MQDLDRCGSTSSVTGNGHLRRRRVVFHMHVGDLADLNSAHADDRADRQSLGAACQIQEEGDLARE